jgi:hypothetical protein
LTGPAGPIGPIGLTGPAGPAGAQGATGPAGTTNASDLTGILAIANGGTGSASQNFVDLTADQSIAGNKSFSGTVSLVSPTLTGTPIAPTATPGTNTTQVATTAFVSAAVTSGSVADATQTSFGKIQLAGDLSGTAAAPLVATGSITTSKLADASITDA